MFASAAATDLTPLQGVAVSPQKFDVEKKCATKCDKYMQVHEGVILCFFVFFFGEPKRRSEP